MPDKYLKRTPAPATTEPAQAVAAASPAGQPGTAIATATNGADPLWKRIWRNRVVQIGVLVAAIGVLTVIFFFQDLLVKRPVPTLFEPDLLRLPEIVPANEYVAPGVIVLADQEGTDWVKYIHGTYGEGTWTFLGGHDPEDPHHQIGDAPTDLDMHPNSPGYRLILNNVLFPAAQTRTLKT